METVVIAAVLLFVAALYLSALWDLFALLGWKKEKEEADRRREGRL